MIRRFIVAPSASFPQDIVHHVCETTSRKNVGDVYDAGDYVIVNSLPSLEEAKKLAKKLGSKRPTVI